MQYGINLKVGDRISFMDAEFIVDGSEAYGIDTVSYNELKEFMTAVDMPLMLVNSGVLVDQNFNIANAIIIRYMDLYTYMPKFALKILDPSKSLFENFAEPWIVCVN